MGLSQPKRNLKEENYGENSKAKGTEAGKIMRVRSMGSGDRDLDSDRSSGT